MSAVTWTSRWIAAARAQESARPDRLFDDPFADALANAEGLDVDERNRHQPTATLFDALILQSIRAFGVPYLAIRTRFFDDLLLSAVDTPAVRQVVILAAGMDARAFRLPWPTGTRLYELDRPEVLAAKAEVLAGAGARPRCERQTLGVDLADPSWSDALRGAGYDAQAPSAWLIEGLLMYLEESSVRTLLGTVAGLGAPGSRLGADVISRTFLTAPLVQPFLAMLAAQGATWRFGTDAPEQVFGACGWKATAMQPGEGETDYGRWPPQLIPPRELQGVPRYFLVRAQRATAPPAPPPRTRRRRSTRQPPATS